MLSPRKALWASTSARGGISTFVRTMQDTLVWEEWNIRLISTHTNGAALTRIAKFATGFVAFLVELIFHRPDVVHLHTAAYGSFVRKSVLAWTSTLFRVPVVLHMHGADFHIFFDGSAKPIQALIRSTLEKVDALVALGDAWASTLGEIAPRANIVVIPNAVKPQSAVDHLIDGPANVVFLGEIGDRKGTFTLLDAWAKMLTGTPGKPRAHLSIAGDGDVDRARNRVEELELSGSVEVHGWMTSTDAAQLIADAQVLVLPSRDEGQPMAILEAMARGLCVVASNVGGIPELLSDDCGVLVRPDHVDELATALSDVIFDREARASFGSNASQRIRDRFDVDVVSRRFDELYRNVAD